MLANTRSRFYLRERNLIAAVCRRVALV